MKYSLETLRFSSQYLVTVSLLSLSAMLFVQSFGSSSIARASDRDEFPGRRQGGGTHWVVLRQADANVLRSFCVEPDGGLAYHSEGASNSSNLVSK